LWSPLIFAGFPVAADPQVNTFYPPAWAFAAWGSWNAFVIAAYVMAASVTYGYVFTLTGSIGAALVGGLTFAMSGFFMAHLGHTTLIQGALWIPLLIWALEQLRRRRSRGWIVVLALSVAMCAVGGHPQMLFYGLGLGAAYVCVMGRSAATGRMWFCRTALVGVSLGLGLAAVQLVPTAELARLSQRAQMSFSQFTSYALPPGEAIQLLFPHLFVNPGTGTYFGTWGMVENAGYTGILPLMAALIAVAACRRDPLVAFWAGVVVVSVMLSLGAATPLATVIYHVPGYNSFRCPARHLVELALAVAVLAGCGLAAVQRAGAGARRLAIGAAAITLVLMVSATVGILAFRDALRAAAAAHGVDSLPVLPWRNSAVGIPLLVAVAAALLIVWYARHARSRAAVAFLVVAVGCDLGSFGWYAGWRPASPPAAVVDVPPALHPYARRVAANNSRIVTLDGVLAPPQAAPPNLNRLWQIPSASGYTPLELERYATAVPLADRGLLRLDNRVLDILAADYLFLSKPPRSRPAGLDWSDRLQVILGHDRRQFAERIPPGVSASRAAVVGVLGNAAQLADGAQVGLLKVYTDGGRVLRFPIRAGSELSDWESERVEVRPFVRHRRAAVADSVDARDADGRLFTVHFYRAEFELGESREVQRVEVEWRGAAPQLIGIAQVSLTDDRGGAQYLVFGGSVSETGRWRHVENLGDVTVYENLRAMPRAWLVSRVETLTADEILLAIQSSRLPDGVPFDPGAIGLVEEPLRLHAAGDAPPGAVAVTAISDTRIALDARAETGSFLILSDVYYPGWRAYVDGRPTHIYQTDYLLRGVVIPPGRHSVEFVFRPRSSYVGLGLSAISAVGVLAVIRVGRFDAGSRQHDDQGRAHGGRT
jgi:hypothetical protein